MQRVDARDEHTRALEGWLNLLYALSLYLSPIEGSRAATDQLAEGKSEVVPQNGAGPALEEPMTAINRHRTGINCHRTGFICRRTTADRDHGTITVPNGRFVMSGAGSVMEGAGGKEG